MFDKLLAVEQRYDEILQRLGSAEVQSDPSEYRKQAKALAEIEPLVEKFREYKATIRDVAQTEELVASADTDMRDLAHEELKALVARRDTLLAELKILIVPKDPNDEKNVVLEIRAGTGGDEAALFAGELFRMYARYAERQGWRIEVMSSSDTGVGGLKEVIATIEGRGVYSRLKYESGVHRVQRVPATEASGRIHTSTATVAVLPEAEEVDIQINEKDLRIDTFCSSGPGGQSVNTTYSAVRLTHIPTGVVVSQQDEKSQIKNRAKAMKVLRARLYEMELRKQQEAIAKDRRSQVGTGERSEKIRTYNFPQNRITDHRINFTTHRLAEVLNGDLAELLDAVNHPLPVGKAQGRDRGLVIIHARVAEARERLRLSGIATNEADLDARLLAEHVLGWDTARFIAYGHEPEPPAFATRYLALVARRADREPVAYITGQQEFWGLSFEVSPAVLIPRPETEIVVEAALEAHPAGGPAFTFVDACTGSGCIAVAIAHERPHARGVATDISAAALEVARRNAVRHDVDERVRFAEGDLLGPRRRRVRPDRRESAVRPRRRPRVAAARSARPRAGAALFAGPDGLDLVRRLVAEAPPKLKPGGLLIFEFGFRQDQAVEQLLRASSALTMVAIRPDLQRIPRTAIARRTEATLEP